MDSPYLQRCLQLQENATYSAETHHILAKRWQMWYKAVQLVPAVTSAIMGTLAAGQIVPHWTGTLALIAAIITAIGTVLNPLASYYEHLSAAKAFTILKHDAGEIKEVGSLLSAEQMAERVRGIHNRYNDVVRLAPPTEDWAFEEARKRIKQGVHEPDEH